MNISSEIFTHEPISTDYLDLNGTEVETGFDVSSAVYTICFLLGLPVNSYVIWLIVTGTGNGLAAEFFILNLCVCEMLVCFESFLMIDFYEIPIVTKLVDFIDGLIIIGHPLFEALISVERYLAVVHPVTFLKYKPFRYRVMCCGLAWLAMLASGGFLVMIWMFVDETYIYYLIITFLPFLFIQLFCCVSVLRALKQSGPGERGREREEENHRKRRAFYFILITTVCMITIYTPYIIIVVIPTTDTSGVYMGVSQLCFTLAGLVQPVLFLYREQKLKCIKCQSFFFCCPAAI